MPTKQLVLFSSQTCAPCAQLKPLLEKAQEEFGFDYMVHTLEINPEVFRTHNVRTVPTMMLFEDDIPEGRFVGATTAGELRQLLQQWGLNTPQE